MSARSLREYSRRPPAATSSDRRDEHDGCKDEEDEPDPEEPGRMEQPVLAGLGESLRQPHRNATVAG